MKKWMPGAVAVALVLVSGGVAHADAADDQFLGAVSSQSIQGPPEQLVALARQLCGAVDLPRVGLGVPPMAAAIMDIRSQLSAMGNSPDAQWRFAQAANSAYCPDKQIN